MGGEGVGSLGVGGVEAFADKEGVLETVGCERNWGKGRGRGRKLRKIDKMGFSPLSLLKKKTIINLQ